ncbi:hypothetical protein [Pontiella sulfatireligans]|uniref:Uncharacterized protein n=1 Tax=Pontiella sulfatireligans TaxID=2750658 RepID=A0A6C2UKP5_9BACT|nr:hypothetical protein [Pontiella sulfatireligans]VGO20810.1 hypothetical protein SCARR_02877 [Pontiella sulfatireligans]
MNSLRISVLFLLGCCFSADAQCIPLPSFTIYGEVQNFRGVAYSSGDDAVLIAEIDGEEVDRCSVVSGIYPGLNYRLEIPMATSDREGYAQTGDAVELILDYADDRHAVASESGDFPTVGQPGGAVRIQIAVGSDIDDDGFVDEYEELLSPYYESAGKSGAIEDISPNDDFDHDGVSNYDEYIAGTIPVDGSDLLLIRDFYLVGSNTFAIAFMTAPGRSYTLPKTGQLSSNQWEYASFSQSTNSEPSKRFLYAEADQYMTLFIQQETNSAMFRLEVQ